MVNPEMRTDQGGYHALPSAMFASEEAADRAIGRLLDDDFEREAISVVLREDGVESASAYQHADAADDTERRIGLGAGVGALLGGTLGVAATIIPGGVVTIGPLAAAVAGGASGAMGGGIVGALVDQGVDPEQARAFSRSRGPASIVVAVKAQSPSRAKRALRLLNQEARHHERS